MDARKLESWLATFLEVAKFKDYSPNCMIVEGGRELQKGVCGVSLNLELIEAAVERGADFILVHHPHGFWNSDPKLPRGTLAKKLKLLLENGISVYGYHLPLDGHPVVGNNAQIASALGLFDREGFAKSGEGFVGCQGQLEQPVPVDEFLAKISEAVGEGKLKILFRHVVPNGIFPIIANTTMGVASAILTESSLAFLGLGDPNIISWGQIIQNGKSYITTGWWICLFAGLAIIYTVITFYLLGDGLNRILSPKLRGV